MKKNIIKIRLRVKVFQHFKEGLENRKEISNNDIFFILKKEEGNLNFRIKRNLTTILFYFFFGFFFVDKILYFKK